MMGGWTHILLCSDGSFHVGSSSYDDVHLRVAEHKDARYVGYTSYRRPVVLVWAQRFADLCDAHARERQLKGWSRPKKLALIAGNTPMLESLASRRAGKPRASPKPKRREMVDMLHSVCTTNPKVLPVALRHPEVAAKRPTKDDQ